MLHNVSGFITPGDSICRVMTVNRVIICLPSYDCLPVYDGLPVFDGLPVYDGLPGYDFQPVYELI